MRVPLLFTFDKNFVEPFFTTLHSALRNSSCSFHVFVMYDGSIEESAKLKQRLDEYDVIESTVIKLDHSLIANLPRKPHDHVSLVTYCRLFSWIRTFHEN
jgi:lipopolysaccharide biosynthesis glycosyltransferase